MPLCIYYIKEMGSGNENWRKQEMGGKKRPSVKGKQRIKRKKKSKA